LVRATTRLQRAKKTTDGGFNKKKADATPREERGMYDKGGAAAERQPVVLGASNYKKNVKKAWY